MTDVSCGENTPEVLRTAILNSNLLPLRVVPLSMVVWCKFAETDKCLKNLKGNQRRKLQSEKASPAALNGLWKLISPRPANRVVSSLSTDNRVTRGAHVSTPRFACAST